MSDYFLEFVPFIIIFFRNTVIEHALSWADFEVLKNGNYYIYNICVDMRYSCLLTVTPGFHKPIKVVNATVKNGDNASLECAAQGFPLHVELKVQKDGEDFVQPCITSKIKRSFLAICI